MSYITNSEKLYELTYIETERLLIRPICLDDARQINEAINNSLDSLQKWMPWANDPSINATLSFVREGVFAIDSKEINNFPMVVIYKENNKIIGVSGYNERSIFTDGLYEIGYWCDINFQGKGLVTEYVHALTRFALDELKARTVIIRAQIDNVKSINVAKRLGFEEAGIVKSVTTKGAKDYYFALNSTEKLSNLKYSCHFETRNYISFGIINWAKECLDVGLQKNWSRSKAIVKTPWSSVYNLYTQTDNYFLKWCPKELFIESSIFCIIHKYMPDAPIPKVLNDNEKLNCFLTKSCGHKTLRNIFQEKMDFDLWYLGLENYTKVMRNQERYIEEFINIGVPDWRMKELPELYKSLLFEVDLLEAEGLSDYELNMLRGLYGKIKEIAHKLENSKISQTFINSDFNENNMVLDVEKGTIKIIDLGEAIISHPFFTIAAHLSNTQRRYGFSNDSYDLENIKTKWLGNWQDVAPMKEINADYDLVLKLLPLYFALSTHRLYTATEYECMSMVTFKVVDCLRLLGRTL